MDIMTTIGTIGTFSFGILSVVLFIKSKRIKRPVIAFTNAILQTVSHPDITINFKNEIISNLSRTYMVFFNKGAKEIRAEDVPSKNFPIIEFVSSARILSHTVLKVSSKNNNIALNRNSDTTLEIKFDYLNSGDGAVIEVLYEMNSSKDKFPVKFSAPIIGAKPLVSYKYTGKEFLLDRIFQPIFSTLWVIGGIGLLYSLFLALLKGSKISWIGLIGGPIFLSIGIIGWKIIIDQYKRKIPAFAEEYFE